MLVLEKKRVVLEGSFNIISSRYEVQSIALLHTLPYFHCMYGSLVGKKVHLEKQQKLRE